MRKFILAILCIVQSATLCFAQLNTDRLTAIGRNAMYFNDYVVSIQYFNQVIRLKPYLSEPYLLRGIAKIQLADYNGALIDLNESITRNPFFPGAFYTRGFVYRQLEQYDKAEEDFTEALRFSPENQTYLVLRADVRSEQKKYDLALEDIDFLLHRNPTSSSYLFEKGVICMAMQDTLCALQHFKTATEKDGSNPANWSALGVVNMYIDSTDAALNHLTHAINLGSKYAGDYINRGILYYRRHNYRGALSDYDQAVKLAPDNAQCYYNRALLRAEVGDYNNAITDIDKAIELSPDLTEMRYNRALISVRLRQWNTAMDDLHAVIERYPYFLPAYQLAAQTQDNLGNHKEAYRYRQKAHDIEQNARKSSVQHQDSVPDTDVHMASGQTKNKDRRKLFSQQIAQNNQDESIEEDPTYTSQARGDVQNRRAEIINCPNILLSYYRSDQSLRRTNYFHYAVDQINRLHLLPADLYFTSSEVTLTADMVNYHFSQIARISSLIDQSQTDAMQSGLLFFSRAMEFALVKDYQSAIDDCTRAILLIPNYYFFTFCRANWRYMLINMQLSEGNAEHSAKLSADFDIMFRDYDYVIEHLPDFSFAYYNKANILCIQQQYEEAIKYYSRAIQHDADFAEAYFNRGLTYIYIDEVEKGIADLSKAGELGIYQAYNLIKRLQ